MNTKYDFKEFILKEMSLGNTLSYISLLKIIIINSSKRVVFLYRLATYFNKKDYRIIASLIFRRIANKYGIFIGKNATIGIGLKIPHPNGIVIGDNVHIGDNCTIFHEVTLGGARIGDAEGKNYPTIGNNVVIFTGAKILGSITIGDNSVVGANSVVLNNVPSNSTAVGIPARIIKLKI